MDMMDHYYEDCPGQLPSVPTTSLPFFWERSVSMDPMYLPSGSSWDMPTSFLEYAAPPPPVESFSKTWDYALSRQLASKLLLLESQQQSLPRNLVGLKPSQPPTNSRFKTEICRNFKEKGSCVYGGLCQFAHGNHELRQDIVRHTKYKTKLCQKYWIAGYCAYGPRCNFVHDEAEKSKGDEDVKFNPAIQPPPVIRRAVTGFTRPQQTHNSTLVRNVSDVIRIAKIRAGSQGDSGVDSGSEEFVCPLREKYYTGEKYNTGIIRRNSQLDKLSMELNSCSMGETASSRPIGSERTGKKLLWPGV